MTDRRHDQLADLVREALADGEPSPERFAAMRSQVSRAAAPGATTLRDRPARRGWWIGGIAAAAATIALAFLLLPAFEKQTTVSAAEMLGRSRAALAAGGTGVEVLTYDLGVGGVLAELLPDEQSGTFTVEETIDHDHPGRYRLLKIAPGGEVVGGVADDPVRRIQTRYLRAHGRGYLLRFSGGAPAAFSIPDAKRTVLQALVTLMQAEANPALLETSCDGEACYEITIGQVDAPPNALVSLSRGRAIVTAADARLVGFSAAGLVAGRPFGLEFTLRSRIVRPAAPGDDTFELAAQPGDVVLEGEASSNPMWDVVGRALASIPEPR